MQKFPIKTIMITGTNGKSTTCKLLQHILKTNKMDAQLGGNIGKPILNLKIKQNTIVIIEASSFQLFHAKFIKPTIAAILNITKDHLDWHGTAKNYQNSKFNIFSNQDFQDQALLNKEDHIKKFNFFFFRSKLIKIQADNINKDFKKKIINKYLLNKPNLENVAFAYKISTILKVQKNIILRALNTFKSLPHRNETFYQKRGITFVNDSKATSFDATQHALKNSKNIFWIVGGLPKLSDKFRLQGVKKNIIKSYIIGKNINYFKKQIGKTLKYKSSFTLEQALKDIIKDLFLLDQKQATVLLSPASASYDQFNNFAERGNRFKLLTFEYARKFL